uniref:Methyltransferase domain-containing protein n=1 Tax=Strombidium inclinatum TaxID=197538 RepID=A0A7S3MUJ7_9SPIT|mmetsp:Transcript_22314/g.34527  ORF Transcript_22314/g.34527 Transcript_22314/m.34527 type:complete len:236 (+) Transcript_22314:12-719(+)|eukprot:CAMPEP_0170490880 /NCGR_PEP_ID=MMETSP0208-20121228/9947_1 /TAXON_ID=197538 /ORGANISM="Strombidium inclinatum, Strain S3" /LENGTH=235 /DNA_ID=CAMNT_0010766355 /DNA_START=12 /DNA_END=719 /DNA_ORIENTATION=+
MDKKLDFTVDNLTDQHKKEMEKHGNFSQDTIKEHYDDLCNNYEDIYLRAGFHDPKKCAELTNELFEMASKPKEEIEVLDMGCGTGLVGKYLHEMGFKKIVGLDASKGMLDECEKSKPGVHTELVELFLGKPESYPERLHNKFDFITASGILADNHLDTSVFEEMLLSLKKGGVAVFATRTEYLTKYAYGPYMKKLEEEGKWKFVKEVTFARYDQLEEVVGRFSKTEAKAFAYVKL